MSGIRCSDFKPENLETDVKNISTIKGKNLKLVNFSWCNTDGSNGKPPSIEFDEGVPLKFDWDATDQQHGRKICLDVGQSDQWIQFLKQIEARAIDLASDMSKQVTGDHCSSDTIRQFKWFGLGSNGQIKVEYDPSTCPTYHALDDENLGPRLASLSEIQKGSIMYPVIRPKGMWFNDQFGVSFRAEGMVIKPITEVGDDFYEGDETKSFTTNRMLCDVDLNTDLAIRHALYTTARGSIMYFFNMRTAELPRLRTAFGSREDDNSVSVQLDVSDARVAEFCDKIDEVVTNNVAKQYPVWFGREMTPEVLRAHLYKNKTARKSSNPRYDDKVKLKIYTDESKKDRYTQVFFRSDDGELVPATYKDITPRSELVCQFTVSHLHFKGSKSSGVTSMGTTLAAKRIIVYPDEKTSGAVKSFRNWKKSEPAAAHPCPPPPSSLMRQSSAADIIDDSSFF